MNAPVDTPRDRPCIRCQGPFTERVGTVTRICDRCRHRDAGVDDSTPGTVVDRHRERTCIRCGAPFTALTGEITRLCPTCDSDHVVLE